METDPLSPEERRRFDDLVEVIREELAAQIAIGRLQNPYGGEQTAGLIADVIWRAFEVHEK